MKGEKNFFGKGAVFMELTLQEKLRLINFFEFLLDEEVSKPLGEMNSEAVDNYIKILLHLQDKHVELSPEFINEQVRKIFHPEEITVLPEAVKTTKKYFNKKKVWLVAACIAILVALFSLVSVAYDWNVFDYLSEKFGSVHSAPIEKEQSFNGVSVFYGGKSSFYPTIEDALKSEKVNVLYPTYLPNDITITEIVFYEKEKNDKMAYTFNNSSITFVITLNTSINDHIRSFSTEIKEINGLTCYICNMSDIANTQIYFEHNGNLYMLSHTDKKDIIKIIKNLKEINYEN